MVATSVGGRCENDEGKERCQLSQLSPWQLCHKSKTPQSFLHPIHLALSCNTRAFNYEIQALRSPRSIFATVLLNT
jgi:hypothetical protein